MARFKIAKRKGGKSAMRVVNKKSLLAFFDVEDHDEGLLYRDMKLMESGNGRWVSSPSGEPYQKDGKDVYPEYVTPLYDPDEKNNRNKRGSEFFKAILSVAEAEYDRLTEGGDDEDERPARKSSKPSKGAAKKPARKAAPAPFEDFDDEDSDLPF